MRIDDFKKLIEKGSKISTLSKDFHLLKMKFVIMWKTSSTEPKSNFSFPQIKSRSYKKK